MVRNDDYIKKILYQIIDSHRTIQNLKDLPGDLDIIKKEILKINGFFTVLVKKLSSDEFQTRDFSELKVKLKKFLENYYFLQEIETMSSLYSEDSDRLKNMRLKILEAFEDRKLIEKILDMVKVL